MSASSCLGYELSDVASEVLGAVPNSEVIELDVEFQARVIIGSDDEVRVVDPRESIPVGEVQFAENAGYCDDKSVALSDYRACSWPGAAALPTNGCISERGCGAANPAASASNATCLTDQSASAIG